ncbi:hypothetical protein GCM10023328_43560 [Modestobacter marinus]
MRRVRSALAVRLGSYCRFAAAASTRARVLGSTAGWPDRARLAVLVLTPAAAATELNVAGMARFLPKWSKRTTGAPGRSRRV